jgi:hypothetical protein
VAEDVRRRLSAVEGVRVLSSEPDKAVLSAERGGRGAVDLLSQLFGANFALKSISITPPSLNSLFLAMTGRELRE